MKFIIDRTSYYDGKPCKGAFKSKVEYWHERTCSEEYFDKHFSDKEGLWRSKGKNHTVINKNWITRKEEDNEVWCINIDSLKELLKFMEKYGDIVIMPYSYNNKDIKIEIYDGYRE